MNLPVYPDFKTQVPGLPKDFLEILRQAASTTKINKVALVGGIVRDRLITLIHKTDLAKTKDIDLVVEGSAKEYAINLIQNFGKERAKIIRINTCYETVEISLGHIKIDIASARKDTYRSPGENPFIKKTTIEKDLERRDFTINAIAIEILSNKIIDPYNGIEAIRNKELELLHPKSISDDPTRVIRCARYAARLDFKISSISLDQIKSTIKKWPWKIIYPDHEYPPALSSRLRMELELLLNESRWINSLNNLKEWGSFLLIDKSIQKDRTFESRLLSAKKLGLNMLTVFISGSKNATFIAKRLKISDNQINLLIEAQEIKKFFENIDLNVNHKHWSASKWCKEIEKNNWKVDSIAIAISQDIILSKILLSWFHNWRFVKPRISPAELMANGWEQGNKLGQELKRLRDIELDKLTGT